MQDGRELTLELGALGSFAEFDRTLATDYLLCEGLHARTPARSMR
jgi:hypothetical protein